MSYFNSLYFDDGLNALDAGVDELHLCTTEPTTYLQATSTYSMANKTSPVVSAPTDKAGGGREVSVSAISDGAVTADGVPGYVALVDTVNSRLWIVAALTGTEQMYNGDTFTLGAFAIGTPSA